MNPLPGTSHHQQILESIIAHYADDDRILAVLVFGSLGHGDWDAYSDLDLDIVIKDGVVVDVAAELGHLCTAMKNTHGLEAVIIAQADEGDVVLSNLVEFSIRYHPLHDTKPAILDSMVLLAGTISLDQVRAAGEANRIMHQPDLTRIVNQCIRYTVELYNAIQRQRPWMAYELLHRIRQLLMQLFTVTHEGERPLQFFESHASAELQMRLKALLPGTEMTSVERALDAVIHLLEHDLDLFNNGQYELTPQQRLILHQLR